MSDQSFDPRPNFLGLPPEASTYERSEVLILPVPYEATTCYKKGTRLGPSALIDASSQLELYDCEFGDEPALRWGVHTLPSLVLDSPAPERAIDAIAAEVAKLARTGKFLVVLGGEHAISIGVARGLHSVFGDFLTVQLDAHADLRDRYDSTPYSHACAARRIAEMGRIIQIGVRSLDISEARFLQERPDLVVTFFADDLLNGDSYVRGLAEMVDGQKVFLTLDVDVLDPSIMPATGTPEPGGLLWHDALEITRTIARYGDVIGFDCVELSPIPGQPASDFTAAKLVYKSISYVMAARPNRR